VHPTGWDLSSSPWLSLGPLLLLLLPRPNGKKSGWTCVHERRLIRLLSLLSSLLLSYKHKRCTQKVSNFPPPSQTLFLSPLSLSLRLLFFSITLSFLLINDSDRQQQQQPPVFFRVCGGGVCGCSRYRMSNKMRESRCCCTGDAGSFGRQLVPTCATGELYWVGRNKWSCAMRHLIYTFLPLLID
jgi:hypothetical protein